MGVGEVGEVGDFPILFVLAYAGLLLVKSVKIKIKSEEGSKRPSKK
jgi:hypothetical protein